MALSFLGKMGIGLAMILVFLLEWFYPVLFETLNHGVTPGKGLLGLQVVQDDLTPMNWQASVIRNLLRTADFLPLLYLFGLLSILIDRRFRRLGDLAAGTLVIHRPPPPAALETPRQAPRPPRWPLLPEEQQALLEFARRADHLTRERRDELARLASPLSGEQHPADDLLAIARWTLEGGQ